MTPLIIAESFLGQEVKNAGVSVLAYFNDAQRQAIKDAGAIAAMASCLNKKGIDKNILVYRHGGCTFDVSLQTIDKGVFKVVATSGDTHLGGEDFDERVMKHFIKLIKEKSGKDLRQDEKDLQKLRKEVEKGKCLLLITDEVQIEIKNLFEGFNFSEVLTRAKFEEITNDLLRVLKFETSYTSVVPLWIQSR